MKAVTIAILLTVITIPVAQAKCRSSWVCDDYGNNCRTMQVCDKLLDLPSVGLAPLRPLPALKLKPLPSLKLPPLGTRKCEYKQVNGYWQNICR